MLAKLYSNISICFMKKVRSCEPQKEFKNVINFCNLSLELDPAFPKPLVNRADANYELKHWEEALNGALA